MSAYTDERPNARAREQRMGLVTRPRFEDYREKHATYFTMERRNGILQVQMHTTGGPVMYGLPIHNAWSQLWLDLGNDLDNEVLIFSGTGDKWIAGFDPEMSKLPLHELPADAFYEWAKAGGGKIRTCSASATLARLTLSNEAALPIESVGCPINRVRSRPGGRRG